MICSRAKEYIADSWQRELDPAAEAALKSHLAECAECAAEMQSLSAIWERFADLPAPEPSYALDVRWQATLDALTAPGKERSQKTMARGWWPAAVAFASLLVGVLVGYAIPKNSGTNEISQLRREVASTRAMVALSLLQEQSATERLRGVDYSIRMPAMEPEIVSALIQAVNGDPSVNVRLAAIDALSKDDRNPGVLNALTRSLGTQDSPMVQAALVDYLADAHAVEAIPVLRQFAARPGINPAVLDRAQSALHTLSQ